MSTKEGLMNKRIKKKEQEWANLSLEEKSKWNGFASFVKDERSPKEKIKLFTTRRMQSQKIKRYIEYGN